MLDASVPDPASDDDQGGGATRPDQMSGELCKFLAAIDTYRRTHGRSNLQAADVRRVLHELGYRREGRKIDARTFEREYEAALLAYKRRSKRLFPSWSEVHALLLEAGWRREAA